ncbi:hypothetical protein CN176_28725 [Sinorhizobium medicae]|uniref:hypothetical protein n=1 Tax=Sinorhizobium medicae TaxID=110321 RepID=UPI000FD9900D|nr:hypothetical protein [Sinorhizobium medicae]RVJ33850.1 hypothetical protein CN176_28725 [Sinorhizobium medicae]
MLEVIGIVLLFAVLVIVGPFVSIFAVYGGGLDNNGCIVCNNAALVGFSLGKAFVAGLAMVALLGFIVGRRAIKPPVDRAKSDEHEP